MARHPYYYSKDKYSYWHRKYEGIAQIDIDACEVCRYCYEPLAIIETATYKGHTRKNTYLTELIADRLCIPSYMVFYYEIEQADKRAENPQILTDQYNINLRFVWRNLSLKTPYKETNEYEWVDELYKLHENHKRHCKHGKNKV
jgi:hypothetical protein